MAFKINIRPELEREMESLLKGSAFRSKTEYINTALADFNKRLQRQTELDKLRKYYQSAACQKEAKQIMKEFSRVRKIHD